jgi:hypothetical protein
MSSMLEQAIIDAKELKEAAQQNAQEAVIERYQIEIKEAVDKILEQEEAPIEPPGAEMDMGMDMEAPPDAEAEGDADLAIDSLLEQLPFIQTTSENDYIDLDLRHLEESLNITSDDLLLDDINSLLDESVFFEDDDLTIDEDLDFFEEEAEIGGSLNISDLEEEVELEEDVYDSMLDEVDIEEEYELEEISLEEDSIDADLEVYEEEIELEEDYIDEDLEKYEEVELEEDSELYYETKRTQRKNKALLKERKLLNSKAQLLEGKLDKYGTIIKKLENKLNESSLQNAKLLYQNRVLDSISLNERQKDKIVEAIQNTNSVEEAKIIFETLQSTVGSAKSKSRKAPESLNEVVARSSSAFIPRKEEKRKDNSSFAERMKILAGLK